ncbi:type VII secretion-associated serine protease mycosin [Mycobacterium sp. MS1601]|uniref:type VII secretion-associated serine protease mycosin n=1 Tax=Mycobacterium sp. MS1601 TaxID=1936029 RepID=UPI0009792E90|nr:type VII secretion-associated serine protease mycosin [Mycobacterium sp. MS1601]AQA03634.1 type VII secretion-associated serine protease mycosin [Mycobacterium sp. MS1601]
MIRFALRCVAVGAVMTLAAAPAAWAITPPEVDPNFVPPPGTAGPQTPMTQRGECVVTGLTSGFDAAAVPGAQTMLNLAGAWQFSRGEGQTVAVVDTGVQPGPRLPNVDGGGDYVANGDGLTDCDGHGTLVAGIIAGQPGADGFSGVAPAARVLSIRQTSAMYAPTSPSEDQDAQRASIAVDSLARAVVRAADEGARVMNISAITCLGTDSTIDQNPLGAALRYAAVERDVVIVAAAGNAGPEGMGGGLACQSNPLNNTGTPDDPRNWAGVVSVSLPSSWQPYVLSVGSLAPDGQPSPFAMSGPWVGIAAPGQNIVSVSNSAEGGLADGIPDNRDGLAPVHGSSYAAAYVAGVAALVRSRFPDMPAAQVIERLTATAHNGAQTPSNLVGAGTVDPVAALTWQLPEPQAAGITQIAAPEPPEPANQLPRNIALGGTAALALVVAATALVVQRRKETTR